MRAKRKTVTHSNAHGRKETFCKMNGTTTDLYVNTSRGKHSLVLVDGCPLDMDWSLCEGCMCHNVLPVRWFPSNGVVLVRPSRAWQRLKQLARNAKLATEYAIEFLARRDRESEAI